MLPFGPKTNPVGFYRLRKALNSASNEALLWLPCDPNTICCTNQKLRFFAVRPKNRLVALWGQNFKNLNQNAELGQ
jgi:hypothetical protein